MINALINPLLLLVLLFIDDVFWNWGYLSIPRPKISINGRCSNRRGINQREQDALWLALSFLFSKSFIMSRITHSSLSLGSLFTSIFLRAHSIQSISNCSFWVSQELLSISAYGLVYGNRDPRYTWRGYSNRTRSSYFACISFRKGDVAWSRQTSWYCKGRY